ncbi:MAG: L-serine ammonia-lyase, iron-sulfur-dependent, subunit alpha [Planctomycetota bacterium]|nr:L-serine ammonia-lyase, iron-sulfur-dependent, subunit alpha [Planctomycetota bacterium]
MLVSIFNDVIGPVMRGPSSSHCAAALRIGRLARDLMEGQFDDCLVEFDRGGSLPTTHDSQGSDMGLFGGLLGWEATDERLPGSMQTLADSGVRIRIETVDAGDPHPSTYRLTLTGKQGSISLHAISTGGGMIEVIRLDGFAVALGGDAFTTLLWVDAPATRLRDELAAREEIDAVLVHERPAATTTLVEIRSVAPLPPPLVAALRGRPGVTRVRELAPVLPVLSRHDTAVPFATAADLLARDGAAGRALWQLAIEYEMARGGLDEATVEQMMVEIVRILRRSIAAGIAGTTYADRVLGWQSGGFDAALRQGKLLDGGALNRAILYVTALMEVKSSMGVIVAMPTAGACAALPGVVIALAEGMELGELEMARAFLAAGLVGAFIATAWTFAAEVGGCQAEGGAASAMAAAALVGLAGGSAERSLAAASMALQNMIGLICDPIANRVEAPCLGKNVSAAANALSSANMALAGFDPVIPLDEVIATARRVAAQMPRELRCTALGGLSITPTSLAIEARLAAARTGCGSGGCGCH